MSLRIKLWNIHISYLLSICFQIYGGDTFAVRLYRTYFQARTSLEYMWTGNPVLTTLIFGLPLGFLSLIFYSVCCTDILDAEEEDSSEGITYIFYYFLCQNKYK